MTPIAPIITPVSPDIAGHTVDPLFENWLAYMYPPTLTGQPAISLPCGFDSAGLPVGLQIVGRRHGYFSALDEDDICDEINLTRPDVIWVGLSVPLEYEFAVRNRNGIPSKIW